jgi:DsbC/DsbD-like thiol-disulfide interchange protein
MVPMAVASMGLARAATAAASPWVTNPQSMVRLISADRVATRQGELRLGVQFRLAPRWHVYWKNSGDAGFAPMVTFSPRPGLASAELLWPAPHRYELPGGLEAFGYAGEVVYPVKAALDAKGESATLRLTADVDYLVCEVDCVPHRYQLTIDQPLGDRADTDPETAPLLDRWFHQVPLPADRQPAIQAQAKLTAAALASQGPLPAAELRFELRLRGVTAEAGGADLFFETHPALEPGRPRARQTADSLIFEVPVRRKDTSAPLPAVAEIAWTATGLVQDGRPLALAARLRLQLAGRPLSPAARQRLHLAAPPRLPLSAAPGAPQTSRAAAGARGAAEPAPEPWPRGVAAAADPRLFALAAMTAALLALERWGLLRRRASDVFAPYEAPSASVATQPGRMAVGFLAMLLTIFSLYALSLEISGEGLAGVQLSLLASALLAWLRQRTGPRRATRALLAAGLAACIVAAPWLAGNSRRPDGGSGSPPAHQAESPTIPAARAPS